MSISEKDLFFSIMCCLDKAIPVQYMQIEDRNEPFFPSTPLNILQSTWTMGLSNKAT